MSNPVRLHRCPRVSLDIRTNQIVPARTIILSYSPWCGRILYEWQLIQMGFDLNGVPEEQWRNAVTNGTRYIELGYCLTPTEEQMTPELLQYLAESDAQAQARSENKSAH